MPRLAASHVVRPLVAALALATGLSVLPGCATTDSSAPAGVSVSAKPAGKPAAPYFETNSEDGKTYVFGSPESMIAYSGSKKLPAMTTHYNKGKAVEVEEAYSGRLIAEYESQHK